MTRAQDANGEKVGARLLELAERCEQATGPDRDLDGAIKAALQIGQEWTRAYPEASRVWAVSYTASIDAAMTLVPEGVAWGAGHGVAHEDENEAGWAWCGSPDEPNAGAYYWTATPALALCAAALKARAASADTHAERGDSTEIEAPSLMSGAVGEAETPRDHR